MKREQYIPIHKDRLINQQIIESNFNLTEETELKKLFYIIENYLHYECFQNIRELKHDYAAFDSDKTTAEREEFFGKSNQNAFKQNLYLALERGNYKEIENEQLKHALTKSDLLGLELHIDFDHYKEFKVFVRGYEKLNHYVSNFIFWRKKKEFEMYNRAIIYIEYKDKQYFDSIKKDIDDLAFSPSTIIIKIFKRVPKNDLETIFPNAVPKMSFKDKLLLWIPALIGGFIIIRSKVIPLLGDDDGGVLEFHKIKLPIFQEIVKHPFIMGMIENHLLQAAVALSLLGMYLSRQYKNFLFKKIHFSKMLAESLYFKNIANNSGVFPALIDAAEEEELKDIILAYTFLYQNKESMTAKELDKKIESWFLAKFDLNLDFDIEDALKKIERLGIGSQKDGKWSVIPIHNALEQINKIWSTVFKAE